MADISGMTIGIDLPSYGELAKMNHNAERRERDAKRKIEAVRVALASTVGKSSQHVRSAVLNAIRDRRSLKSTVVG